MLSLLLAALTTQAAAGPLAATPPQIVVAAPAHNALESEIPSALRSQGGGTGGSVPLALAALGALGGAAWFARRRRTTDGRLVRLLETTSLGPKRSLVLASLGEQTLLLGTSEAGVTLLACLPAQPAALELADRQSARLGRLAPATESAPQREAVRLANLFQPRAPSEPSFDVCLDESLEDQQLRAALSQGLGGKVQ